MATLHDLSSQALRVSASVAYRAHPELFIGMNGGDIFKLSPAVLIARLTEQGTAAVQECHNTWRVARKMEPLVFQHEYQAEAEGDTEDEPKETGRVITGPTDTELAEGDTVLFELSGTKLLYSVKDNHLRCMAPYDGANNEVFRQLGLDPRAFCGEHYGYPASGGIWPYFLADDYAAATRVVNALYREIESKGEKKMEDVQEAPKVKKPRKSKLDTGDDASAALAKALRALVGEPEVDLSELEGRLANVEAAQALHPRKLEVYAGQAKLGEVKEAHHYLLPELLQLIQLRLHTILIGPAGTGKSHVCHQAAEALSLPFYAISIGPQMTQASLMGYTSPAGTLVRTSFRDAFEHGGVMCLDEVDAGSAAVLTCINSAMANGVCGFPDGMVKRHPDFVLVCTANTYGTGKTMEYVGRNPLDAAFLNRFARMTFPVDENLEKLLSAMPVWTTYVQAVRKEVEKAGIKAVVSPRQSIMGGKLIVGGFTPERARELLILPGLSEDAQNLVKRVALPVITKEV